MNTLKNHKKTKFKSLERLHESCRKIDLRIPKPDKISRNMIRRLRYLDSTIKTYSANQ